MKLTIREYVSTDGRNNFREWLDSLAVPVRARIQARILRFETGNLGDYKSVGEGVWEARVMFGPGYRIYFGKESRSVILLFLGGDKSSQTGDIRKRSDFGKNFLRISSMARRTKDWNEGLANDLRNPAFAREFLLAAAEEGISLQHALGKVIRAMGVKEFAEKVCMESPNLLRAINPRHNPTQATINRLLNPFGLKLSLAPILKPKRRNAA